MNIKFTSKNVKMTGPLKAFIEKQLKSVEKVSSDIIDCEVIANEEKLDFRVEITVRTKLNSYHIEDKDPILKQAIRNTLNTLKSQAKKNKEKLKKEKKRKKKKGVFNRIFRENIEETEAEKKPTRIAVSENFSRKPLSVEEAIFFLEESGENAYMFVNAETSKTSVVFFDKKNNISIIEAIKEK